MHDDEGAKTINDRLLALWATASRSGEPPDLGDYASEPVGRYLAAMADSAVAEAELAHCADRRARALADLHEMGWSYGRIADVVGLSRARVQQLVERGRLV